MEKAKWVAIIHLTIMGIAAGITPQMGEDFIFSIFLIPLAIILGIGMICKRNKEKKREIATYIQDGNTLYEIYNDGTYAQKPMPVFRHQPRPGDHGTDLHQQG